MQTLEGRGAFTRAARTRRLTIAAAALAASVALLGSAAPSSAFGLSAMRTGASQNHERSSFERHFYRGVPNFAPAVGSGDSHVTRVADDDSMEAAMAYCTGRFKSYDPSTGTYLGYDGVEHACP